MLRSFAIAALLVSPLVAAVDGVVINQTTGNPQPGVMVTLYQLGGSGMQPVTTMRTDGRGSFRSDAQVSGSHLIQVIHDGVLYNQMLQPGGQTTGLQVSVYDSSIERGEAHVAQHMILIEPMGSILHISESVIFHNEGNITYNDPENGTLRVYLPPEMQGEPQVMVSGPQGVPLERPAVETSEDNIYMIDYAIKPGGETRFDLTYVLPAPETGVFEGKILHGEGPVRLVTPMGVTLTGENVIPIGQEPSTQASVYDVQGPEFSIQIEGSGQLNRGEPAAQPSGGSGIERISARVYERLYPILGLAFLILLVGFTLLYRRSSA